MLNLVYSIEGNIGSGKTILLNLLARHFPNSRLIAEPVHQWQDTNNHNLLDQYYQNPHRWAYTFQNYALLTRFNTVHQAQKMKIPEKCVVFAERSVEADKQIFAKMLLNQGKMTQMEFKLYERFYADLQELYKLPRFAHIYLKTDPRRCLERIKKRGREEEAQVDLEYLNQLHEMHENWCGKASNMSRIIVDGNLQFETDMTAQKKVIDSIKNFINPISMRATAAGFDL